VITMIGESGPRDNLEKGSYTTLHLYAPLLALVSGILIRPRSFSRYSVLFSLVTRPSFGGSGRCEFFFEINGVTRRDLEVSHGTKAVMTPNAPAGGMKFSVFR
jgi:hypothetical protein